MVITCKKPCKKKKSTMLTVEQMVDIALGTPEIGAVNFNVLHALLHVLVQQLNIQKCLVEFKGFDSERMEGIILTAKPGPIIKLSEYIIDATGKLCTSKSSKVNVGDDEKNQRERNSSSSKPACQCTLKIRKRDIDDEEKDRLGAHRSKADSKGEDKPVEEKAKGEERTTAEKIRSELKTDDKKGTETKISIDEDCVDEADEKEPMKIKPPKKCCPCKVHETIPLIGDDVKATASSYYGSDSEGACQTIVRVEPVGERCDSWRARPALAHESMVRLEEKVAMLQDAFEALEQMPTNDELKKRTQAGPNQSTPVKDLWQLYNLNKRVEGCEGTIDKLTTMIEDMVKEICNFKEAMLVIADAVDEIECADLAARTTCGTALQGQTVNPFTSSNHESSKTRQSVTFEANEEEEASKQSETKDEAKPPDQPAGEENVPPLKVSSMATTSVAANSMAANSMAANSTAATSTAATSTAATSMAATSMAVNSMAANSMAATSTAATSAADGETIRQKTEPSSAPSKLQEQLINAIVHEGSQQPLQGIGNEFFKMSAAQKFCTLKLHIDCLVNTVKQFSENVPMNQINSKLCALVSVQKQLDALEKDWRGFVETFGGDDNVLGLCNTISNFKIEFDSVNNNIKNLEQEKLEFETTIKTIMSELENLKKVKVDFEIMEDMLAEKADASVVNRKVSHDQFDAACDDLTKGIDETLERLMQQEALWNEAMDEVQKDLDNKLDKNEMMPLKEFINKKLKCLQDKLKQLAQLKKDAEAAGAKSRILRNLNCIACDGDVVMRMENAFSYHSSAVPPQKGIKPMISYELDQVRKAMRKGPCKGANYADETVADMQKKMSGIPLTQREVLDNKTLKFAHYCNRYCGGSHTITTAQQRVTRIGHFLTEFGPQAMAMFSQENPDSKNPLCPPPHPQEIDIEKSCL